MHAMQYPITLPADYDMEIIRHRVKSKGHLLDDFEGLGLKAYAIRERGVDGSPVNQYAPFYLWADPQAMNRFVTGDGFRGVIRDFGRPVVQHWQGLFFERGPACTDRPHYASRSTERLAEGLDPATAIDQALSEQRQLAETDGVHSSALGLDPRHWELVRFTLWRDKPAAGAAPAGELHQVLHLSAPGLDRLPTGRQW